jgi:hypothetical protein
VFHQQAVCLDKDDAPPLSIHIPATAVSDHERSVKAEAVVANSGETIATSKLFDLHFPKQPQEKLALRNSKRKTPDSTKSDSPTSPGTPAPPSPSTQGPVSPTVAVGKPAPEAKETIAAVPASGGTESLHVVSRALAAQNMGSGKEPTTITVKNEPTPATAPVITSPQRAGVLGVSGAN